MKMARRVRKLEDQLQCVQNKLSNALKFITKQNQELEMLRGQISQKISYCKSAQEEPKGNPEIIHETISSGDHSEIERKLSVTEEPAKQSGDIMKSNSVKENMLSYKKNSFVKDGTDCNNDRSSVISKLTVDSSMFNSSGESSDEYEEEEFEEMRERYLILLGQLREMEKFLADYGLIWVGESNSNKPMEESIRYTPNFDKVLMVIGELNNKRSSESDVEITGRIGHFKKAEIMKLTIFADGIQLEDNPFREYSSESVQEFFHDLEDGYYPTELKDTYPNGFIFKVIDKRAKTYNDYERKNAKGFSGKGHRLGSSQKEIHIHEITDKDKYSIVLASESNTKIMDFEIKKNKIRNEVTCGCTEFKSCDTNSISNEDVTPNFEKYGEDKRNHMEPGRKLRTVVSEKLNTNEETRTQHSLEIYKINEMNPVENPPIINNSNITPMESIYMNEELHDQDSIVTKDKVLDYY